MSPQCMCCNPAGQDRTPAMADMHSQPPAAHGTHKGCREAKGCRSGVPMRCLHKDVELLPHAPPDAPASVSAASQPLMHSKPGRDVNVFCISLPLLQATLSMPCMHQASPGFHLQVKAAKVSRRCSLGLDARRQMKAEPQPVRVAPMMNPPSRHADDSHSQLHRQKAAERGRAALLRARQHSRAQELSRLLNRCERATQLHRKQHGIVTARTPVEPALSQAQDGEEPCRAVCRHQRALCAAQQTAYGGIVTSGRGMPCQVAEHAEKFHRAPLQVIAQTQWQLQSVRPGMRELTWTGDLHSARAARHTKLPSDKPSAQGMARGLACQEGGSRLNSSAANTVSMAAKRRSVLPRVRKEVAQQRSQMLSIATKPPEQSSIARRSHKSPLKRRAVRDAATVKHENTSIQTTEQCSVSFIRGLPSLPLGNSRRPASGTAYTVSPDADNSAPASPVPVKAKHAKPLAKDDPCKQQVCFPDLLESRGGPDLISTIDAAQCEGCPAYPVTACMYRTSFPCPATEEAPWPALPPDRLACAMPCAVHAQQEGEGILCTLYQTFNSWEDRPVTS